MLQSVASLINELAEGTQAYAEQKWEQSISLVKPTLDGDLSIWLEVGCLPYPHCIPDEGSYLVH